MTRDFYRAQHAKIREILGQLKNLGGQAAAHATEVRELLNKLTGVLAVHLTAEDHALYPRLIADSRHQISAMARAYQDEMGGLKQAYTDYATKWSKSAIADHGPVFTRETQVIIKAITTRMDREERELYPAAGV